MEFRHVDAFRALMLTRTTTNAASLIGSSQSAVSRLLAELEELTQLTLFDRQRGRLLPTKEAQILFEEVQRRYAGLDYLREFAMQLAAPQAATLKVGTLTTYSLGYFGLVLAAFRRKHPQAKVVLSVGSSEAIRDHLLAGSVELGIVAAGRDISQFHQRAEFTQRALCAIPAGHPLAAQATVSLADLLKYPLITYQEADMVRWGLTRLMARHAKKIDIAAVVRYAVNVCALVSQGVGVGLVQAVGAYDYLHSSRIVFRPLEEDILFHTYLVVPSTPSPSALGEEMIELMRSTFEEVRQQFEDPQPHLLGNEK